MSEAKRCGDSSPRSKHWKRRIKNFWDVQMNPPSGEWTLPIVGDQWPYDEDLMALSHGKLNRGQIKTGFMHFADMLRNAQSGPLANQQGYTADDLRDAFRQGEEQARQVAEKNGTKESAYGSALRQHGMSPTRPNQFSQRVQPADQRYRKFQRANGSQGYSDRRRHHQGRALASMAAAKWSGNVFDAMQRFSTLRGPEDRRLASSRRLHGLDASQMFRLADDQPDLGTRVRSVLEKGRNPLDSAANSGGNPPPSLPTDPKAAPLPTDPKAAPPYTRLG